MDRIQPQSQQNQKKSISNKKFSEKQKKVNLTQNDRLFLYSIFMVARPNSTFNRFVVCNGFFGDIKRQSQQNMSSNPIRQSNIERFLPLFHSYLKCNTLRSKCCTCNQSTDGLATNVWVNLYIFLFILIRSCIRFVIYQVECTVRTYINSFQTTVDFSNQTNITFINIYLKQFYIQSKEIINQFF